MTPREHVQAVFAGRLELGGVGSSRTRRGTRTPYALLVGVSLVAPAAGIGAAVLDRPESEANTAGRPRITLVISGHEELHDTGEDHFLSVASSHEHDPLKEERLFGIAFVDEPEQPECPLVKGPPPWTIEHVLKAQPGRHIVAVDVDEVYRASATVTVRPGGKVEPEVLRLSAQPDPNTTVCLLKFHVRCSEEGFGVPPGNDLSINLTMGPTDKSHSSFGMTLRADGIPSTIEGHERLWREAYKARFRVRLSDTWFEADTRFTVLPGGRILPPCVDVALVRSEDEEEEASAEED